MAEKAFRLKIVTPKRTFYDDDVSMLVVNLSDGELGILYGHEPMAAAMIAGEIRFTRQGTVRHAAVSDGFLSVEPKQVVMTVLTAEWPEEIDVERAREAQRIAQEQMLQKRSVQEYQQARAMLTRAMVRLRVSNEQDHVNQ